MVEKALLLILAISLLALPACTGAAQVSPSLRSYLSTYISNSLINSSTYYNQTVSSSNYLLMQVNATSFTKFIVINVTNGRYAMVTDNATAFNAVKPLLMSTFYPSAATLSSLNSSMHRFVSQSNPGLASCLFETGLTYHMCNSTTSLIACMQSSCASVPLCGGVQKSPASALSQFGIPSPFATGILNFSISYLALNSSYKTYFSLLSGINPSNYNTNVNGMESALSSITSITSTIQNNPIFPPPSGITVAQSQSVCSNYVPPNGPWWCYAIGYCEGTTFNNSALDNVSVQLDAISALPVSDAAIRSVAANSTQLANGYLNRIISAQKTVLFNNLMHSLFPIYNSTVTNASALALRINNATLYHSLQSLESEFGTVRSLGGNQNLTAANQLVRSMIANVSSIYVRINSAYGNIFGLAANNTRNILVKELDFRNVPTSLAGLATKEEDINGQLTQDLNVSQATAIVANLKSVQSSLAFTFTPIPFASIVKVFDGGIISFMLSGSSAPVASKLSGGALIAAMVSLAVVIVLFSLFYLLVYHGLSKKHKIRHNIKRVKRAWRMLFAAILIIAAAYVALTYVYASSATAFLPFSGFLNALKGSSNVYIAYNSTTNSSVLACVAALKSSLTAFGKSVDTISLNDYSCASSSNSLLAGTDCLNGILSSSKPLIMMGQGNESSIIYKGLYGHVLYATGSASSGSACILNSALSYK